ncbi:hypothetical protein [Bradyrhizobium sp.]|uniref:hypothetical protein n=1 Tax=Bradyrhizobium sp. TaxID=376 RepID=UPI003C695192
MTPFLKRAFRDLGQEGFPICLEADTCSLEAGRRAVAVLARMQARIEAARPLPLVSIERNAGAFAHRADVHVAVIDVPSDLVRIVGASAGEGLHPP